MAIETTKTAAKAWHPDVTALPPSDVIPSALVLTASTVAGHVEGDEPAVRVPLVRDFGPVGFVPEGEIIPEGDANLDEAVVHTGKIAALTTLSREMTMQPGATDRITTAMQRSLIRKADEAFLNNAASAASPTGVLKLGITDAGAFGDNLDALTEALVGVEAAGGSPDLIVVAPDAWGHIATMKTATGSAQTLLGSGVEAGARTMLGVPVVVNAAAPAGTVLAVDRSAIVSSVGNVLVARSDDAAFDYDAVKIRATFRFGWAVSHPDRIVKLTTASA